MYGGLVKNARTVFARSYAGARQGFLADAQAVGLAVETLPHPLRGPDGEALALDWLWMGPKDAANLLVLLSATHGVEGFCGSACQRDALRQLSADDLPKGVAVLMLHALNPYGFAWLRRVTEDGVDLNRNFVDFAGSLPENPGYDQLADALLTAPDDPEAEGRLQAYAEAYGQRALEEAVSGGQHRHPKGLFYGGREPTWSRLQVEGLIARHKLAERQRVAVIDFHTGLGPYGYGEPICDLPPDGPGARTCRKWFGESVTLPALGTSCSSVKSGLSDMGWHRLLGDRLAFIALEFGTFDMARLLGALRADHILHAQGPIDWSAPQTQRVKAELKRFFFPDTQDWREMVLFRARQVIGQALKGLGS